ncbi:DUF499 domain-containing protein [uncultured Tessaracoccus sp.]|uniref:DUF499 domain-containing protein n=1 Tax=uncultured Tessaracoccus sp. TaxID=905023 RepID=UPI0025F1ADCB|nr:DUF499 domain-containing protein [uncultured Tessaracoccus sp.]
MALSNRDLVGKMLEELSEPLHEFLVAHLGPTWIDGVRRKDGEAGYGGGRSYNPKDVQEQLKVITMAPGAFKRVGGHDLINYASELRSVRNQWAHMTPFPTDAALRALDTGARLLLKIGAKPEAARVRQLHSDLNRRSVREQDRKLLAKEANVPASQGLKPWREVLRPHEDVATGNFRASEFAADLWQVSQCPHKITDYSDARAFFERTYLTTGLRDLIAMAVRRLSGDQNAAPVINLQTNFGGGKTHSMLTLWHLAGGEPLGLFPQEFQELLSESGYVRDDQPLKARRVAIVGTELEPHGREVQGQRINTLWGELAWQLGGHDAFQLVADADATGTNPGAALHTLLERYAPAVILIDEWVAYARQLLERDDLVGGSFETQFTFAQTLTEVAKAVPGIFVAISIPASHDGDDKARGNDEEVGGRAGQEALSRLQNVVRRTADQWRPASATESYHIVRRRLFQAADADAQAAINATAKAFVEFYTERSTDFPKEARDYRYEERIRETYPIHPEVFDRLYEDWSTLDRFQRTRGVLRFMNGVIHALWASGDQSPMIMPGSIPFYLPAVGDEITQYLPDSWKAIIDADVDGEGSEPWKIDADKPLFGARQIAKRLARGVFFGSAATLGAGQKGIETQRLFLGVATPGDAVGNFHSALANLSDRATHFYGTHGRYWYDLQANISRRAKDQAERLHVEDVWAEIVRRLTATERGGAEFARVHVCPEDSGDVIDTDEARLVILHPRATHRKGDQESEAMRAAYDLTTHHGSGNRVHRNMLVHLAADEVMYEQLEHATREYLGWDYILANAAELDLTHNQRVQAEDKRAVADATVDDRLTLTFIWTLVPTQHDGGQPFTIEAQRTDGAATSSLTARVAKKLRNSDQLRAHQVGSTVRLELGRYPAIWAAGHVRVGDLWQLYTQYPYMPRLRDERVLLESLTELSPISWAMDGFALADGVDDSGRYLGLWIPGDKVDPVVTSETLVVQPERAQHQRDEETRPAPEAEPQPGPSSSPDEHPSAPMPGPSPTSVAPAARAPRRTRLFSSVQLTPESASSEFINIDKEVLRHLIGDLGTDVHVRLEIEATRPEGFDDTTVRIVSENGTTLGFEDVSFLE